MPIASSNFLVPNGTFIVEVVAFLIVLVRHRPVRPAHPQQGAEERQEEIRT